MDPSEWAEEGHELWFVAAGRKPWQRSRASVTSFRVNSIDGMLTKDRTSLQECVCRECHRRLPPYDLSLACSGNGRLFAHVSLGIPVIHTLPTHSAGTGLMLVDDFPGVGLAIIWISLNFEIHLHYSYTALSPLDKACARHSPTVNDRTTSLHRSI